MIFTDQLVAVATAYCRASQVPLARASMHALGDRRLLPGLVTGSLTVTLRRADRALQWFSAHWPDGAVWPASVPRPAPDAPVSAP